MRKGLESLKSGEMPHAGYSPALVELTQLVMKLVEDLPRGPDQTAVQYAAAVTITAVYIVEAGRFVGEERATVVHEDQLPLDGGWNFGESGCGDQWRQRVDLERSTSGQERSTSGQERSTVERSTGENCSCTEPIARHAGDRCEVCGLVCEG